MKFFNDVFTEKKYEKLVVPIGMMLLVACLFQIMGKEGEENFLNWIIGFTFFLAGACGIIAAGFSIFAIVTNIGKLIRYGIGAVLLGTLLMVGYNSFVDVASIKLSVPFTEEDYKLAGAMVTSTIWLFVICFTVLIGLEVKKAIDG